MYNKSINISVDKLCIVGDFKETRNYEFMCIDFHECIQTFINLGYIEQLNVANKRFQYSYRCSDGSFIQFGSSSIRIEFNPNKVTNYTKDIIKQLLAYFHNLHLTRLDVACDLYNYDFKYYNIVALEPIKKAYYYDRVGNLETVYFGSQKSNKFFRIYDKAKEQKIDNMDWWRVELQLRDVYIDVFLNTYTKYFESILIYKYEPLHNLTFDTRAKIEYLLNDISRLSQLDERSKRKYKDLIKSLKLESMKYLNDLVQQSKCILLDTIKEYID